jgi:hypothetical protein
MSGTRLACDGTKVSTVWVPSFEVSTGEYVGLADTTTSHEQLHELSLVLAGLRPTTTVRVTGKSAMILAGVEGVNPKQLHTISDFATALGMSRTASERAFAEIGLEADLPYGSLQLTPRLRLRLRSAWSQGAELVVVSTAGLDPLGIASIVADVSTMLTKCCAVHVFSMSLTEHYESLDVFCRIIRCPLSESA